ncbi:class I SAM-dependent methyltransferase [Pontibacterium sp.]|uniref:class I SAM-dependent methyltransferase n=1 Tax=Pontibacterium sp. TaxID=2036026 RepID=UPI0035141373
MASRSTFWDRIALHYSKQPVADEPSYQKKLAVTREFLTPESSVLEFGCGTGSTAITHAPVVKEVLATDISAKMLEIAQGKAKAAGIENIRFKQCDLAELQSGEGSWDVVLGMSILHLVDDKDEAIRRVYNLLKPGGVFVSSTACIGDFSSWFKYIAPLFRWLPLLPNVAVFSEQELKQSLIAAGFKIEYDWRPGKDKAVFIVARKPE